MSQVRARPRTVPTLSRFGWLMGLYAENYAKLDRLFAPQRLVGGRYVSRGDDGLVISLDLVEQHRYTTELRLAYVQGGEACGETADPSAFVRLYRDAHQAEATHCNAGRNWHDAIGLFPPPATLVSHRLRMNIFLGKWLDHLALHAHGVATLQPVATAKSAGVEIPACKVLDAC